MLENVVGTRKGGSSAEVLVVFFGILDALEPVLQRFSIV